MTTPFPPAADKHALEEGTALSPRFDANGLVTCVTTDAESGELLMVAHMNAEALRRSIETGEAWYWSRSRRELWHKGATSGQIQTIVEMRVDCDQDALWLKVKVAGDGGCCHTGRRSCFYRIQPLREQGAEPLRFA
ncbi:MULTISPECIES: phosphoribosyl-AMP cyclohydrolase [unclassified Bosea (in: a-proteobacteria)]|uniref:phosphoribosyl-AMP cyclohydrolase n=1 Tax=unclassified Bosea (in: a-proteobacteria) TaxID=2653178 RepID=UPI000956FC41|nr:MULTISPECIES: phosphoribosyl-AMP cyclohydrolase [unclassified Bosea (in: a-proteobacteria)]TAJ31678.1 MAG: phosphoribosyl-AMP cyclohydrolase [Bosea sp. (in: a-proteobacteria)]SIQ78152.1 phosphoribosyl-AMP cyclohydrolase [Bosea sp. TND4EK4]